MRKSLIGARETGSQEIFLQLDVSASFAVIAGQNLRAIRIAGAGSSFRKTAGVVTTEVWPGLVELYLNKARASVDPSAAVAAWDESSIMTVDKAVDQVLSGWDPLDAQLRCSRRSRNGSFGAISPPGSF